MAWIDQPVHFIDFEGSLASGVLEYGVVTLEGGSVVSTQSRLCRPTGRVRPEDTLVHGLEEKALRPCAPFSEDWELFASLREKGPLAAHFAGAESSLLRATWPYPRSSPDFARPGGRIVDWGPWIDTGRLYAQLYPGQDSARLESLVSACGLQGELDQLAAWHCPSDRRRYHAALYDALAGAVLLCSLARVPQLAGLTLMHLLALSTLDPKKRDAIVQRELF
jgi:DNA polymerase-3 subunit epsilon